jgi:predicted transcriptional regulator
MNVERDIFAGLPVNDDDESDARALADIAAGRVVSHAEVSAWLATWGTPDEKPMPPEWRR